MPKAPPLQQEEERGKEDKVVAEGAEGGKATGDGDISVTELANLLRAHMARTDGRETARKQEQADQERWFKTLHHQFGLLQLEVHARIFLNPYVPDVGREARGRSNFNPSDSDKHSEASVQQQGGNQVEDNIFSCTYSNKLCFIYNFKIFF